MRRLLLVLLLLHVSGAAAQAPPEAPTAPPRQASPWPAKGDYIYIAATFKGLDASSGVPGARSRYDMPPCARLRVAKAKPNRSLWTVEDAMGGKFELLGPWPTRMHKGKTECEVQIIADGEPALARTGDRFMLAPKKKAPQ